MTTYYEVKKCLYMTFVKDEKFIKMNSEYNTFKIDDNNSINNFISNNLNGKTINLIIDATSKEFNDIQFSVEEDNKGTINTQNKTQDVKGDIMLGAGNAIDAFSQSKFAVINGKHNAGIQKLHPKQNNDVIDSLAINGVMYSPKPITIFSIGKIMNKLSDSDVKFHIYIIHPSLSVNILDGSMPSLYVKPTWIVGDGEILAVFYRYLCMYFFGYMSIYDEDNFERSYDI